MCDEPVMMVDLTSDLSCPLLGLFGIEDSSPSPSHVQLIEQELKLHDKVYETYVYDNQCVKLIYNSNPCCIVIMFQD